MQVAGVVMPSPSLGDVLEAVKSLKVEEKIDHAVKLNPNLLIGCIIVTIIVVGSIAALLIIKNWRKPTL